MNILLVYSGNSGTISPFIKDQAEALEKIGIKIFYYPILGKGILGYLKNIIGLRKYLNNNQIDLIHAHYGLSGLVTTFQNKKPVVTTFHGSDINNKKIRPFSRLAAKRSDASIYVSEDLLMLNGFDYSNRSVVIPCGVDLEIFKENRALKNAKIKILFSSSFDRSVKNYPLARGAIEILEGKLNSKIDLIELKGYDREKVSELMSEVNLALLTSFSEGSPQFIKEVMACGCPAVATDVGDIKWLFGDEKGYFITDDTLESVANSIEKAILFSKKNIKTKGRKRIKDLGLSSEEVAKRIIKIYRDIL